MVRQRNRRIRSGRGSTLEVDFSVPLTHHDGGDNGLIILVKKRKIIFEFFRILKSNRGFSLKKRTLSL